MKTKKPDEEDIQEAILERSSFVEDPGGHIITVEEYEKLYGEEK